MIAIINATLALGSNTHRSRFIKTEHFEQIIARGKKSSCMKILCISKRTIEPHSSLSLEFARFPLAVKNTSLGDGKNFPRESNCR